MVLLEKFKFSDVKLCRGKKRQVAQQHGLRHYRIFKTSYRLRRLESSAVIFPYDPYNQRRRKGDPRYSNKPVPQTFRIPHLRIWIKHQTPFTAPVVLLLASSLYNGESKTIDEKWKYFHAYNVSFYPLNTDMLTGWLGVLCTTKFKQHIQSKRTLTIGTGSLAPVSKRPSVAWCTHLIYHRGSRKSAAIPLLPLWAFMASSRVKCAPISIYVIVQNTVSCNVTTYCISRHVCPYGMALLRFGCRIRQSVLNPYRTNVENRVSS